MQSATSTRMECERVPAKHPERLFVALTAFGLVVSPRLAKAEEPLNCVFDEDCPHGRCIDLVCVDVARSTTAKPAPTPVPSEVTSPEEEPVPKSETPRPAPTEPKPPRAQRSATLPRHEPPMPSFTSPASHDVSSDQPVSQSEKRVWYGAPLIATYALTPLVFAALLSTDEPALGIGAAVFASPIVHWVNGKGGKGVLSLFMQPVFAGVGALIGASTCNANGPPCDEGVIAGAVIGYAAWAAIDIGAIAYKDRPNPSPSLGVAPFRTREATGVEVGGVW